MRKICVSGFSGLSADWANQLPEETEIWAMNEAYLYLKRPASRYFQIHPRNWNEAKSVERGWPTDCYGRPPEHIQRLAESNVPVYMWEEDERVPNSVQYPYDEIVERYGMTWMPGVKRPYLTSTASYMMALAIYEHDNGDRIESIDIAGIELSVGTEYFHQRPCFEYWCGVATGRGIKVNRPPTGSAILMGPIYGREHANSLYPESMQAVEILYDPSNNSETVAVMQDGEGNPVGL